MRRLGWILGVLTALAILAVAWVRWNTGGDRVVNQGPVIPPAGPVLLANNQGSGTTTMIEVGTGRLVAHIPVGEGPHEIAASPDGRWAVVTLPGDASSFNLFGLKGNKLAVIEIATATLKRTLDLGDYGTPHGVVFLSDNRTVAVTSEPRHSVVLVDIESGAVLGEISAGNDSGPYLLALSPDRKRMYTANIGSATVSEIDVAACKLLRTLSAPGVPEGIAVSPGGGTLWLTESLETGMLAVLDLKTGATLATFGGFKHPHRVGLSPDGAVALVTDLKGDEIRIYDAHNRRELRRVSTGKGSSPSGLFFTPDSKRAYVTLADGIAEIDLSSRSILRRFKTVESRPDGVVYIPTKVGVSLLTGPTFRPAREVRREKLLYYRVAVVEFAHQHSQHRQSPRQPPSRRPPQSPQLSSHSH